MIDSRAAIVTTLRDAAATLESFVGYHRAIGFKHFFLFFDDPADAMLGWAAAQPDITAIARDWALEKIWRTLSRWNEAGEHAGREVMSRQVLNVEHAMNLARAMGLGWLLHIDADELFLVPGGDAAAHFAGLTGGPLEVATYLNFEAVPEAEETGDFFRSVSLFKKPLLQPPGPQAEALIARAGQRSDAYFHFYGNGKSAVRLGAPGMLPGSVHGFSRPGHYAAAQFRGPFILHYACCGFAAFWQKYATLGRFADKWWGKIDIASSIGTFHLEARDVVIGAVESGDVERARQFYRSRLMIGDPALVGEMMRQGLLARIDEPRRILARVSGRA